MNKLTPKQEKFCLEYLIDLNGTQAAIRAGYSKRSAQQIADENLLKPVIKEFITKKREELSQKTQISSEWVLNRLKDISDRCMSATPVMTKNGNKWVQATNEEGEGIWEFDSNGATRSTELLGKHLGFFEKDNHQLASRITIVGG